MNKRCGWAGVVLVALPFVKLALAHVPFLAPVVPYLDLLPGAIEQVCTAGGATLLALSSPLHK